MRRLAFTVLLAGAVLAGVSCMSTERRYACYGTTDRLAHSTQCPRVLRLLDSHVDVYYHRGPDGFREGVYLVAFDSYPEASQASYVAVCPECMQIGRWKD